MKVKIWIEKVWKNSDFQFEIKRQNGYNGSPYDVETFKRLRLDIQRLESDAEFESRAITRFNQYTEKVRLAHNPDPEIIKTVEFE